VLRGMQERLIRESHLYVEIDDVGRVVSENSQVRL
jgi:hypothetical protein